MQTALSTSKSPIPRQRSSADLLRSLPETERAARVANLSEEQARSILFDWTFWAREEQLLPEGDWQTWLVLAGRGFGKTRVGAETVRIWAKQFRYVNIIAPTADDVRDIAVEGESGILAICPRSERPAYRPSKSRLEWPNGARSLLFTADEPERLRGKQHEKLWADEVCSWRYAESWDQAMFGLRLGRNPQAVVTTTPKPVPIIRALIADPNTVTTRGSTYDNRQNLAEKFFAQVITKYEGTRLGRQELNAELLDDNPRALWKRADIERGRVREAPPTLQRVAVGLDPNVKNRDYAQLRREGATALDEAGIVIAARDTQSPPHFYVLDDRSIDAGPNEWGKAAVKGYRDFSADRLVGEVNNGGDMVEMTIRHVDPNVSYKSVTASRGKAIRAEPIAALYEQGRVHHVGTFAKLEDEMCDFDPVTTVKSPNRMDALVWALTELTDEAGLGVFEYYRQQAAKAAEAAKQPTH
jgi:phage terminase large subunit-like protein